MRGVVHDVVFGVNELVWGWPEGLPLIVVLLVGTGILTTIRLGFVQVRRFGHGLRVVRGDFDDPEHEGDLSHFQALSTALSATVGIGNIAGVATAIHYGGPGALFWMWVTAVFGMALKYTESTLALRYRTLHADGSAAGGPMYAIERGLGSRWKPLAIAFAAFTVISSFGSGNAVQSFTVADQFRHDLGVPTWVSGAVMAALVAAVILGGIRRIGRVTSKLVPFMAGFYLLASAAVLLSRADQIVPTLMLILESAFRPAAQVGGLAGGSFVFMLTWGVKRGLFSNESGQGSAPIAHAAARTDEPVREGMVAMLGPFIDTLLVCSLTGLVILTTGVWKDKQPQRFVIDPQAAVVAVEAGTQVQPGGVVREEDRAAGRFRVAEGVPQGLALVRSHGTVDDLALLYDPDGVGGLVEAPFTGWIAIPPERPGDLAAARLEDARGRGLPGSLVASGRALQNGSPLTSWAFQRGLGGLAFGRGHYLITLAVFLFGISTAIAWSYYGDRAVLYLFGRRWLVPYRLAFTGMHFLGAIYPLELVWTFGDAALGLMTLPNLLSILLLTGVVKEMTRRYEAEGKLVPPVAPQAEA